LAMPFCYSLISGVEAFSHKSRHYLTGHIFTARFQLEHIGLAKILWALGEQAIMMSLK
jgi:hypothetical protein